MRTFEIKLKDNELPAKVNAETGEFNEVIVRRNNIPEGRELHYTDGKFSKAYEEAWDYLLDNLSDKEVIVVTRMMHMARPASNSLEPLSDSTTIHELAETFHIHRNNVNKIFNNLMNHGVYAEFKFGAHNGIRHYWVLNPYISFKGKTINSGIADLFRETTIAKMCLKKEYAYR